MTHGTIGAFTKGVMTGAVVGAAMTLAVNPIEKSDMKRIQKRTGHFFSSVGNMLDNVIDWH